MIKTFIIALAAFFIIASQAKAEEQNPFTACHVTGSTTLYDMQNDKWIKTDEADAEKGTLPASTFKIMHSLIALDMIATTPDEIFKWDGKEREISAWNKDMNLEHAFKNSAVWVYEALEKRIKDEDYKRYLGWAGYAGNGDIDHGRDGNFWVAGNWKISPVDQINMLVKLYKNELPFSRSSIDIVKGYMQDGDVYGKTGWTRHEGKHIGWWTGYRIYQNRAPLFFTTRIIKDENSEIGNFAECRKAITDEIIAAHTL